MARISTHVLDIARGRPAEGVPVRLYFGGELVASRNTNADGRTGEPLLNDNALIVGVYELVFHAGDYLRSVGGSADEIAFLDMITIRFGVNDSQGNYHVPLLLAPYGYSTYRGS